MVGAVGTMRVSGARIGGLMALSQTMALNLSDPPAAHIRTICQRKPGPPLGTSPRVSATCFWRQNENSILKIEEILASLFFAKDLREMKGGTFLSLFCLHLRR